MAAAFVKSASNTDFSNADPAAAFGSNVVAGNLIVVCVAWGTIAANSITLTSITDTLGHTYTLLDNPTDESANNNRAATAYAVNISGGANTVTAHLSGAPFVSNMLVHEASGLATASPLDQHKINAQTGVGTATDAVTSTAVVTTANGEYIFGAQVCTNSNGGAHSAGTGYAIRENSSGAFSSEDQIQAVAGSIAATFTDGTNFGAHLTAIVTFKAAATNPLPSVNDTVTVTESQTMNVIDMPNVFNSVTVQEALQMMMPVYASISESVVTVTDASALKIALYPVSNDTIIVTESVTLLLPMLFLSVNDLVIVTEAVGETASVFVNVFDQIYAKSAPILTALATDTFDRDETPLSTGWSTLSGMSFGAKSVLSLSSARGGDSTVNSASVYTGTFTQPDQFSEATISLADFGGPIVLGSTTATQGYWLKVGTDTTAWTVQRINSAPGGPSTIAQGVFPNARSASSILRIEAAPGVSSTVLKVFHNNVPGIVTSGSLTDSSSPFTSGRPGIMFQGDASLISTWRGGNLTSHGYLLLPVSSFDAVTVAESTTVIEPVTGGSLLLNVNDSVAAADVSTPYLTMYVTVFDAIVLIQAALLVGPVFDSVSVSESTTIIFSRLPINVFDTVAIIESIGVLGPTTGGTNLSISVFDDVIMVFVIESIVESITVIDSNSVNIVSPPTPRSISVNDTVTITEVTARQFNPLLVNLNETITVIELTVVLTSVLLPLLLSVGDDITVLESVTGFQPQLVVSISDSVGVAEIGTLGGPLSISIAEAMTVQDVVLTIRLHLLLLAVNDPVTVIEAVGLILNPIFAPVNVFAEVADGITITDIGTLLFPSLKIDLGDNVVVGFEAILSDGKAMLNPSVYDAITVTDVLTGWQLNPMFITGSDDILATSVIHTIQLNPMFITVSDSILVSERIGPSLMRAQAIRRRRR